MKKLWLQLHLLLLLLRFLAHRRDRPSLIMGKRFLSVTAILDVTFCHHAIDQKASVPVLPVVASC
jgi:hypothetical protein